jgi:DNA-binding XRE family transcriptional regulator
MSREREDRILHIVKKLGEQLRQAREENGRSQSWLSEAVDLSTTSIGMYERGDRVASWPMVLLLAEALNVDVAFFLEDGPPWHVLNPMQPETYIVKRNLASQETLGSKGVVRQFGIRLPLRIMNRTYIDAHVDELPNSNVQTALRTIHKGHLDVIDKDMDKARQSGTVDTVFSSLYGFMRIGDFRKILYMDKPYDRAACNPAEFSHYLQSTIRRFVEHGYQLMLVNDNYADDLIDQYKLTAYVTIATIGGKLAIRQISDFEIAWSFDKQVISTFNKFLDDLQSRARKVGVSEIADCCTLIDESLSKATLTNPAWSHKETQARWRAAIQEEMAASGPEWLRP